MQKRPVLWHPYSVGNPLRMKYAANCYKMLGACARAQSHLEGCALSLALPLSRPHTSLFSLAPLRIVVEKTLARLLAATTLGRRYATKEAPAVRVVIVVAKEARLLSSGPGSGLGSRR